MASGGFLQNLLANFGRIPYGILPRDSRLRETAIPTPAHQERPKSSRLRSFLFKPKGLVCNHGLPCMESPLRVCHFRLNYIQLKLIEFRSTDYIHRLSGDFYFKRNYPSARRSAILNIFVNMLD